MLSLRSIGYTSEAIATSLALLQRLANVDVMQALTCTGPILTGTMYVIAQVFSVWLLAHNQPS